jgi:hypothetical protein
MGLIWVLVVILERMVAHNPIVICIKGVISRKPTLVLVDPGNIHNLMFEVFAISLGHPIEIMDPS